MNVICPTRLRLNLHFMKHVVPNCFSLERIFVSTTGAAIVDWSRVPTAWGSSERYQEPEESGL